MCTEIMSTFLHRGPVEKVLCPLFISEEAALEEQSDRTESDNGVTAGVGWEPEWSRAKSIPGPSPFPGLLHGHSW